MRDAAGNPPIEDVLLINEVLSRYNRSIDNGETEEFLSVFTPEAAWISPEMGTFEGSDAIRGWFKSFYEGDSPYHNGQHRITNLIFEEVGPDRVVTWCNWIFVSPEGPQILIMGNYRDVLVRRDDRWLIERREIELTGPRG